MSEVVSPHQYITLMSEGPGGIDGGRQLPPGTSAQQHLDYAAQRWRIAVNMYSGPPAGLDMEAMAVLYLLWWLPPDISLEVGSMFPPGTTTQLVAGNQVVNEVTSAPVVTVDLVYQLLEEVRVARGYSVPNKDQALAMGWGMLTLTPDPPIFEHVTPDEDPFDGFWGDVLPSLPELPSAPTVVAAGTGIGLALLLGVLLLGD